MAKRRASKHDEYLLNGSVIYWSRRFTDGRRADGSLDWRVPVRCGRCGQVRKICAHVAQQQNFTGLCLACASGMVQVPRSTLEHLYCVERLSRREVAERLGCSPRTVERRMSEYGITARKGRAPQTLVSGEVLRRWSPELAYVVGLIAADGNLAKRGNRVSFLSTDRELIEIYQQCLGISAKVWTQHKPEHLPSHCVGLGDPAYRAFLEGVGLTPAKSKERILGVLKIPDEFFRDFLRGVIDGDGYISVRVDKRYPNYRQLAIEIPSVCRPFLVWIRDTVARLTTIKGNITRLQEAFRLRFTDSKARWLLSWLYYAPDLPCLQRKRGVWEAYRRSSPQPTRIVIPKPGHYIDDYSAAHRRRRWHIVAEGNCTLCGRDAARWDIILGPDGEPLAPEDCRLDDERLCRICRRSLKVHRQIGNQ